jgi:copper oxidase (laccase) domain-containing protein
VAGIGAEAIRQITKMGGQLSSVRCAIGPAIRDCCYEVQMDFFHAVADARGQDFADSHICRRDEKLFADVPGMNETILLQAGLTKEQIDRSPFCTACEPKRFHSHRASHGLRGAMGALIGIK